MSVTPNDQSTSDHALSEMHDLRARLRELELVLATPGELAGAESAFRGAHDDSQLFSQVLHTLSTLVRLLDSVETLVLLLDRQGHVLLFNRALEEMRGRKRDSVLGKFVWDLFDDERERRVCREAFDDLQAGRFPAVLKRFTMVRDGEQRFIQWSTNTLRPEDSVSGHIIMTGTDVTHRVLAKAALDKAHQELEQRVEERTRELSQVNDALTGEVAIRQQMQGELLDQTRIFQSILDSIGDGVIVVDEKGRFFVFNPAAQRILGLGMMNATPDEWTSRYGLYLPDRTTPFPTASLPLMRALRGELPEETEMYVRHAKQPQGIWLSVVARPLRDDAGELKGGVAVFRDVSETKRARDELRAEQQLLEQLLRAHERDRQLMAYEIHDGLVQDVTAALMHLEAYRQQQPGVSDRAGEEFDHALKLLHDTIDEARRLISGLRPPIIDEQGIVAGIEYLIGEHQSNGTIAISFEHELRWRRLDSLSEGTLFRIVQEALNNIKKHSGATKAAITLRQADDHIQLEIRDWGVGFDLGQVTEHRFGLQGIRERARLLRGTAQIESEPGAGTRIFVDLPVVQSLHEVAQRSSE